MRLSLLVVGLVAVATVSMVVDRRALRGGPREFPVVSPECRKSLLSAADTTKFPPQETAPAKPL